ncbi:MAG: Gx transporter family protein [Clostridia bacterium]|nr:Gx transporter family protein [Clostridia bacterium]
MKTRDVTFLGLCVALALILSYVESLLPPLVPVPGVKAGLANVVILYVLCRRGWKAAGAVSLVRLLLSAALFTGFGPFFYSLTGAAVSLIGSALLQKTGRFSPVGVSVLGGVLHNLGQVALAALVLESGYVLYYLPVLVLSGTLAGVLVGLLTGWVLRLTPPAGRHLPGGR